MNTTPPLLDITELERLHRQTLHPRRAARLPVAGHGSGAARSLFRGRGMELDDTRAYQSGDDVRHIDWRATARSGRPMSKVFREERQRELCLVVDRGPSMHFGTRVETKATTAARAAAVLAFSALARQERVAGWVLDGRREQAFAPARRLDGVLPLLGAASAAPSSDHHAPNWPSLWDRLYHSVARGATLCLITDLHHLDETQHAALWRLATRCELVVLQVIDPAEEELPMAGRVRLTAGDGRVHVIDSGDEKLRARYAAAMAERHAAQRRACHSVGAYLHRLYTHRDLFGQIEAVL